jgi:hypothetical protein
MSSLMCVSSATTFIIANVYIISDDIGFKIFSVTNVNSYLRQYMLLLISINSDDMKGRHYLVFTNGIIATTGIIVTNVN